MSLIESKEVAERVAKGIGVIVDVREPDEVAQQSVPGALHIPLNQVSSRMKELPVDKEIYYLKNDSGKFKAEFISAEKDGFSFLKVGDSLDEKNKLVYKVPTFGDMSKMKAGQKIITLGGGIASFTFDGNKDLNLNVSKSGAGGMVLNLEGELIGMSLFNDTASFAPINSILDALKPKEAQKTP